MKRKMFLFLSIIAIGIMPVFSQNQLQIADVEIVNLGDGQRYVHKRDEAKTPVNGKVRFITGMTTEYIDTELKDGYVDGKWDYYERNVLKESTSFKNGYVDGEYAEYFRSGDVKFKGHFAKGEKHGSWEEFNIDGDKKVMEIYDGGRMTKKVTYYLNGNVDAERNYQNGREHGVAKRYTLDGKMKSEQNYVNGKRVGKQVVHYSSNQEDYIQTSYYNENGKLDGDFSEIYVKNNNVKSKGKYKNGQKDGKWITGYANGMTKEEVYNNGVLVD
jgi:Uncharacterized protein conserved in bacteria